MKPTRYIWAGFALLVASIFWVYWPALNGAFVFDDRYNLLDNPNFRGFSVDNLIWAFTQSHIGHYQPLTWLSFMVDYSFWGMDPVGYHAVSISLHAVNAVLFTILAAKLFYLAATKETRAGHSIQYAAFLSGAIFALHPLRVESVAWITERRDVLCTFFFLLSLMAYLKWVRSDGPKRTRWYVLAVLCFLMSLMSKALAMALPVVLITLDGWPLDRLRRGQIKNILVEKIPFMALTIVFMVMAFAAQSTAVVTLGAHPLSARIAQAFYGLVFYIRATFFAIDLVPLYEISFPLNPFELRFILSAILVVFVSVFTLSMRRKWPALLAFWVAYIALLSPVLGFAQSGNQLVADRYSYIACLGLSMLLGWNLTRLWLASKQVVALRVLVGLFIITMIVGWAFLARKQTRVWQNEQVLWEHVLNNGPSAIGFNNLGVLQSRAGRPAAAVTYFARSLSVAANYTIALNNLLPALQASLNDLQPQTLRHIEKPFRDAMTKHPKKSEGWFMLGVIMMKLNMYQQASIDFKNALAANPTLAAADFQLGLALQIQGHGEEANEHYRRALKNDPALTEARLALGVGLLELGDYEAAITIFDDTIREKPRNAIAWTGLGASRLHLGDRSGAIKALERALELDPNNRKAASLLSQARAH